MSEGTALRERCIQAARTKVVRVRVQTGGGLLELEPTSEYDVVSVESVVDAVLAELQAAGALAPANPCPYCGRSLDAEPDTHVLCMAQAEHDWIGDGVTVGALAPAGLTEAIKAVCEFTENRLDFALDDDYGGYADDAELREHIATLRAIASPAADAATGAPS